MKGPTITANMLTAWLRRGGNFSQGHVAELQAEPSIETTTSNLIFLEATYSTDASPVLPRRLAVKIPRPASGVAFDPTVETQFYRRLAPTLGAPPAVRCLTAIEAGDDAGIIVLEDLRRTHDHPTWPIPPSRQQCEAALEVLAQTHFAWWEAPALGQTIWQLHTEQSLTQMVQGIAAKLPEFFDEMGDALPADARRVYERVFASPLRPWLRLTDPRALTVTHGDAHAWNFLFPRGGGSGPAYLLDWQLWHLDVGARDLAFFMALHWYPSHRREVETDLVRYYYDRLLALGMTGYSFDDLWLDYRLCVVRNLTFPIILWARGANPESWWHRLECAVAAYQDLHCDELL